MPKPGEVSTPYLSWNGFTQPNIYHYYSPCSHLRDLVYKEIEAGKKRRYGILLKLPLPLSAPVTEGRKFFQQLLDGYLGKGSFQRLSRLFQVRQKNLINPVPNGTAGILSLMQSKQPILIGQLHRSVDIKQGDLINIPRQLHPAGTGRNGN